MKDHALLSRPTVAADIPPAGTMQHVVATPAERVAIAKAFAIPEIRSLEADFEVKRALSGAIAVDGRVRAAIVQTCVVSLVPVEQTIDEEVHERFVPEGSPLAPPPPKPGSEAMVPAGAEEGPDVFSGPMLDLGDIALQNFLLAVDPYPRAPDAAIPASFAGDTPAASPFAVLAGLAKGGKT